MINFFKKNKYQKLSKKLSKLKKEVRKLINHENDEEIIEDLELIEISLDVACEHCEDIC